MNKMELLQSQAPAEGELLENSAVRTFRHLSLDIGYYNFDIGYYSWEIGHLDLGHWTSENDFNVCKG